MLEPYAKGEEWEEQLKRYDGSFFSGTYIGFCSMKTEKSFPKNVLQLRAIGGISFCAADENECGELETLLETPAGKSCPHKGLEELHACYREAYSAWQESFFSGKVCVFQKKVDYKPSGVTAGQLAGLIGLSKEEDVIKLLRGEASRVYHGEADPNEFAYLCGQFIDMLAATYSDFIGGDQDIKKYGNIWDFGSIGNYLKALDEYLKEFCAGTEAAFSDFENKQKIRQAVQYVQAHFREQLNMAEVSNRVSMNYSLFSTLFKQYTGHNFVNYLQNLRIDEAKRLLETTDWYIYEIGRRAGFTDDKHFLKIFKSTTGFSPSDYRKSKHLMNRSNEENN